MQTTNNSLDFSSNQLKKLKELVSTHKLQEKYKEIKTEFENLAAERSQYLENSEKFTKRLLSIKEEFEIARKEESDWERKLKDSENSYADNKIEFLQDISLLFGYDVFKYQIFENNRLQVTLRYCDICYISYSETDQIYDIVEIYPQHPNFLQIQKFLKKSQDLRGLLASLRKYFDIAISIQQNIAR